MAGRSEVIQEARTWLGTPFHHRALVKGAGVDCAYLIYGLFRHFELIPCLEIPDYSPQWWAHRNDELILTWLEKAGFVEIERPEPADVVVAQFGRAYAHIALVLEWPRIIHADPDHGEVELANAEHHRFFESRDKKFFSVIHAIA